MTTSHKLDMTTMFTYHDALRRDLEHIGQMTARSAGWDLFKKFLHVHHRAEDEALWPVLRQALSDRSDVVLVYEMETEHTRLDPLLEAIDAALDRGDPAPRTRAELTTRLGDHLTHEEEATLPVIDRTLDEQQWMQFAEASAQKIGPDMPTFLPWLLAGAEDTRVAAMLDHLPEPTQQTYRNEWQPAFAAKNWWAT